MFRMIRTYLPMLQQHIHQKHTSSLHQNNGGSFVIAEVVESAGCPSIIRSSVAKFQFFLLQLWRQPLLKLINPLAVTFQYSRSEECLYTCEMKFNKSDILIDLYTGTLIMLYQDIAIILADLYSYAVVATYVQFALKRILRIQSCLYEADCTRG